MNISSYVIAHRRNFEAGLKRRKDRNRHALSRKQPYREAGKLPDKSRGWTHEGILTGSFVVSDDVGRRARVAWVTLAAVTVTKSMMPSPKDIEADVS
jgi:hypothetical protein